MHKLTLSRKTDGGFYSRDSSGWAVENGLRHRGTLWDYGTVGCGSTGAADLEAVGHPARFPLRLVSDIVQCFSPPGGLVCDPFLGGGTSLVGAFQHGRNFIGGDLFGKDGVPWVDIAASVARDRWEAGPIFMFGATDAHSLEVVSGDGSHREVMNPGREP